MKRAAADTRLFQFSLSVRILMQLSTFHSDQINNSSVHVYSSDKTENT